MSKSMFVVLKVKQLSSRTCVIINMASAESNFAASFLRDIGLSQYESRFLLQGFENLIDVVLINVKDLDLIELELEHKDQILKAGKSIVKKFFWLPFATLEFTSFDPLKIIPKSKLII